MELKFNEKKIKLGIDMVPYYRVMYKMHLFDQIPDFSDFEFETFKTKGPACYSGLFTKYKDSLSGENYLTSLFMAKPSTGADGTEFSEEHISRWVELCTKYKLLPATPLFRYSMERVDIKERAANKETVSYIRLTSTFFIDGVFQPTLYMWLDNFRHLREDQGFVMSVIYLHDELGIDFYVSYIMASYFNISNTGHHTLPISRLSIYDGPGTSAKPLKDVNNKKSVIDLKLASVLYRMCNDFYTLAVNNEPKSRLRFVQREGKDRALGWYCNGIHGNTCRNEKDLVVPITHLLHENVGKIVRAEKEEDRQSLLEMIK